MRDNDENRNASESRKKEIKWFEFLILVKESNDISTSTQISFRSVLSFIHCTRMLAEKKLRLFCQFEYSVDFLSSRSFSASCLPRILLRAFGLGRKGAITKGRNDVYVNNFNCLIYLNFILLFEFDVCGAAHYSSISVSLLFS